ncbi:MAG: hypothetical protein IPN76_20585 [Saprospiraceae bacterium]|nr:hypothetical protein [Saprospiraceae bacterium]
MENWHAISELSNITNDNSFKRDILVKLSTSIKKPFFPSSGNYFGSKQTKLIKYHLTVLGLDKGFWVYANRMKEYENEFTNKQKLKENKHKCREWMYDIHWYKDSLTELYMTTEFPVVIECEWQYSRPGAMHKTPFSAVKYDFQKLLITNANLKVLIFKSSSLNSKEFIELDSYFNKAINIYPNHIPNSNFLFICFIKGEIYFCEKNS